MTDSQPALATSRSSVLGSAAGALLCVLAALSATFLSGVNFPEPNNLWHVPIVLNYAGTLEGPHDTYDASFSHFVSAFWILPRLIATDANLGTIFIRLQMVGNAALGLSAYMLIRAATQQRAMVAALVAAFFCFCYGLWGYTRLGYSEIFATYATHTQFAMVFCLLSFVLLLQGRPLWSAVLLSFAADANLFMAVWSGLSAGLFLILVERRLLSRKQISFAVLFAVLTIPISIWALHSGAASDEIPLEFFQTFIRGHVYALAYPQAALETFALGLAASFAALAAGRQDQELRCLGLLMLSCVAVLGFGAALPYVTDFRLVLLLHPLRFTSVVILLSACCAGALLVKSTTSGDRLDPISTFIAVAGFLLKSPAISIFGLVLGPREITGSLRYFRFVLMAAGLLGQLLDSPITEASLKSAWAYLLSCMIVSIAAWGRSTRDTSSELSAKLVSMGVLGGIVTAPTFQHMPVAVLLSAVAVITCLGPMTAGQKLLALGTSGGAGVLLLLSVQSDPEWLALLGAGLAMVTTVAYVPRLRNQNISAALRTVTLIGVVAVLVGGGLAKGAASGFSVTPSTEQRDLTEAGVWARANTPPDTTFLPVGAGESFTVFSRRPAWWGPSQGAAVLWLPSFYNLYACRKRAIADAITLDKLAKLAIHANIRYLLVRKNKAEVPTDPAFRQVFENTRYVILRNDSGVVHDPICPEVNNP